MSNIIKSRILNEAFYRFFGLDDPQVLTAHRAIQVTTELHGAITRTEEQRTGDNYYAANPAGNKLLWRVPHGEMWLPEMLTTYLTTGTTARMDNFMVLLEGYATQHEYGRALTPAVDITMFRGIDFSKDWYLYPGDLIYARVSTGNAGDLGAADMVYRKLRVADDF